MSKEKWKWSCSTETIKNTNAAGTSSLARMGSPSPLFHPSTTILVTLFIHRVWQPRLLGRSLASRNPYQLVQQAQVVPVGETPKGWTTRQLASRCNYIGASSPLHWRQRWLAVEHTHTLGGTDRRPTRTFTNWLIGVDDGSRPGGPARIQVEQIVQIDAVGCEEPPEASGRPIPNWTTELAMEVVKRGMIVDAFPP